MHREYSVEFDEPELVLQPEQIAISVRGEGDGRAAAPAVGKKIVLFGQKGCTIRAKT